MSRKATKRGSARVYTRKESAATAHPAWLAALRSLGLPSPVAEFVFAPPRRWRFDYAWRDELVAVEVDGGVWSQGRHVRAAGFLADCEKLNIAALRGWIVLRYTPQQLLTAMCMDQVRVALDQRGR